MSSNFWWEPIQNYEKFGFYCLIGNNVPTICICSLFNSWGVPFHVAEEARVVYFLMKPLVDPYLRDTLMFERFLTKLAQA